MKSLFFGIVALLVGLPSHSQTAPVESEAIQVQSETVYLVLRHSITDNYDYASTSMVYIPMESIEQCNIAGATIKSSKRFKRDGDVGFECIEGK